MPRHSQPKQITLFMILRLTMIMIGRYGCQSPEFARLGIRKNFRKNLSTTSTVSTVSTTSTTLPPLLQNSTKTPPPLLLLLPTTLKPKKYSPPQKTSFPTVTQKHSSHQSGKKYGVGCQRIFNDFFGI